MAYGARPVPQNIMNVEFKLFDFMTLKQFLWGFGLLALVVILYLILPGGWRFGIPLLVLIFGVVVIFVPFNGEPFQAFISAYLEAMISPQRRVWNKKGVIIKSAYQSARKYQFGNDPGQINNDFKFQEAQKITLNSSTEQSKLDNEEEKFINSSRNNDLMSNKFNPPTTNENTESSSMTSPIATNPTSVSQSSVKTTVDLNKYRTQVAKTEEKVLENSDQPLSNSENKTQEENISQEKNPVDEKLEINVNNSTQSTNSQAPEQRSQENLEISLNAPKVPVVQESSDRAQNIVSSKQPPQYLSNDQPQKVNLENTDKVFTPQSTEVQSEQTNQTNQTITSSIEPNVNVQNQTESQPIPENIEKTITELKEMTSPQIDKAGEEFMVKNYVFGSVEDEEGKPIANAAIVLKSGEENLEIVYSTENGDFQTHYEYKEGIYTIHANVNSEVFNEFQIKHDPVDPVPIIIRPKQELLLKKKQLEEEKEEKSFTEDGVFVGNYDANVFNLGDDYDEIQDSFETTLLHKSENIVNDISDIQSKTINNSQQLQEELESFESLQESWMGFDPNGVNYPNMINGSVYDRENKPIENLSVQFLNGNNELIKSVGTDNYGRFSSFGSLPDGFYYILFKKMNYNFAKYFVNLRGQIVTPRLVKSK